MYVHDDDRWSSAALNVYELLTIHKTIAKLNTTLFTITSQIRDYFGVAFAIIGSRGLTI